MASSNEDPVTSLRTAEWRDHQGRKRTERREYIHYNPTLDFKYQLHPFPPPVSIVNDREGREKLQGEAATLLAQFMPPDVLSPPMKRFVAYLTASSTSDNILAAAARLEKEALMAKANHFDVEKLTRTQKYTRAIMAVVLLFYRSSPTRSLHYNGH